MLTFKCFTVLAVSLQYDIMIYLVFSSPCLLSNSPYDICEMVVCGLAFLWHQVRCMVSVLFLIGLHLEKPQVSLFKIPVSLALFLNGEVEIYPIERCSS